MPTMAAIIDTHHAHPTHRRPVLQLVTDDGRHGALVPVELGLRTAHLVAAVVALVAVLLLSLAVGNGALAGLAPAPTASAGSATGAEVVAVEVEAGDTLWSIARRVQPTGDVRPLVDRLVAQQGSTPLQPGQVIDVPR
jgi:nucleoid-associated protein YgaU